MASSESGRSIIGYVRVTIIKQELLDLNRLYAGLLIILNLSACGGKPNEYLAPSLSPGDVVSASREFLAEIDVDATEYEVDTLGFDYVTRDWHVALVGNSGALHDYYWVVVQDGNIDKIAVSGR